MTVAGVTLWGSQIGAIAIDGPTGLPAFQYTPAFVNTGIELSPVRMPLRTAPYQFPELTRSDAFRGLPGLLADTLPDRWGSTLVGAWLRSQGRSEGSFDVVERLCYAGTRGMGALEFRPALDGVPSDGRDLDVALLVELASAALADRESFAARLAADPEEAQMQAILALGTSAGGARPKAVIAYNERTGQVRSGQINAGPEFGYWLLKFDGVRQAGDHGLNDPQGWGAVEFAYSQMATACGIQMMECRLLEEHARRHFMTRRFDRTASGKKIHTQTLAALEHVDYNVPGLYSYEQAFALLRRLGLTAIDAEQLYRRMVFNVVARNQDDHVKNLAFTMDRAGRWALAPAYDLTWSFAPGNRWLDSHQMSLNGRRDGFTAEDLAAVAQVAGLRRGAWQRVVRQITDVVRGWPQVATDAGVPQALIETATASHRLDLEPPAP